MPVGGTKIRAEFGRCPVPNKDQKLIDWKDLRWLLHPALLHGDGNDVSKMSKVWSGCCGAHTSNSRGVVSSRASPIQKLDPSLSLSLSLAAV